MDSTVPWPRGWGAPAIHQPQRQPGQALGVDLLAAGHVSHGGQDGTGAVHRWLHGEFSTPLRIGGAATIEEVDDAGQRSQLGQVDFVWRFAQGHGWAVSMGAGTRWMRDEDGFRVGPEFIYGIEAWPIAPLVLRTGVALGGFDSGSVIDTSLHVGAAWRHGEVFVGERYLRVGEVSFSGPLLGAGLHW